MESINWKNYFDHLYSLTWPGNKEQIPILQKELDRVDILNSGIYSNFINIRTPFHKDIFDKVQKNYNWLCYNRGFFMSYGHYHIIKEAYDMGYEYIGIVEDDIRFLKDKKIINNILQKVDEAKLIGFDILGCQLEDIFSPNLYDDPNDSFFNCHIREISDCSKYYGASGFNAYSRSGMAKMINMWEHEFLVIDNYIEMICNYNMKILAIYPWLVAQQRYVYELEDDTIKDLYNFRPMNNIELVNDCVKILKPVGINYKNDIIVFEPHGGYVNYIYKIMNLIDDKSSSEYQILLALYYIYSDNVDQAKIIYPNIQLSNPKLLDAYHFLTSQLK